MAQMAKVTINWTGFPGGPGFTNMYFQNISGDGFVSNAEAQSAVNKVDIWLNAWIASIPNSVTVGVDPTVQVIDETNGNLTAFHTVVPEAAQVGTGGTSYASPAGAVVSWYTDTVRNSRRIRGRTFMVPLSTTSYETDGTITNGKLTGWNTASATLLDTGGIAEFGIWARPTAPGATDGDWALVTSHRIPDKVAMLTSRRD